MIINKENTLNSVINKLNDLDISKKDLFFLIDTVLKNQTKNLYFDICYDLINEHFRYAITTEENLPDLDPTKYSYSFIIDFNPFLTYINLFDQEKFKKMLFRNLINHYEIHLKILQESIFKILSLNAGEAINSPIINGFIKNNEILATDYYASLDDYKQKTKNFSLFA